MQLDIPQNKQMVRFWKSENGQRKNTLFTFRKDDFVFFGVSRCKTKSKSLYHPADKFDKELGIKIAKGRALKALALDMSNNLGLGVTDNSQMFGKLAVADVKTLIEWFKKLG